MVEKGNVELKPKNFVLRCENLEIISDGTAPHTTILVDGKKADGVYNIRFSFNTKRPLRLELGVFLKWFTFKLEERKYADRSISEKPRTSANNEPNLQGKK